MSETEAHIGYIERIIEYAQNITTDYSSSLVCADYVSYGKPIKVVNGCVPDYYYNDFGCVIIGEAKTSDDIQNEHTIEQIKGYIRELLTYNCERHLILCTSMYSFAQLNNFIIRFIRKENVNGIKFHIIDNHMRSKII